MASVWGGVASARGWGSAGNSLLSGLAQALLWKRQQEEEMARLMAQLDAQRQSDADRFKYELFLSGANKVFDQLAKGQVDDQQAMEMLTNLFGGLDIPGGEGFIKGLAGFAGATHSAAQDYRAEDLGRWLSSIATSPEAASKAEALIREGKIGEAALMLGMSASELNARAKEANIDLTRAQTEQTVAGAELTRERTTAQRLENELNVQLMPFQVKKAEAEANFIEDKLKADIEKAYAEIANIKAGTEQTKARTEQIWQQITYDALANPYKLDILKSDSEYSRKQVELADAKLQGDWERVKQLRIQTAQDELDYLKKQATAGLDVSGYAIGQLIDIANESAEAALEYYRKNKATFDELGVDEATVMSIVQPKQEAERYTSPKLKLAVDTVYQTAAKPPKPDEREQRKRDLFTQLVNAGLDEVEAKNLIKLMEDAWYNSDALYALEVEKARIESANASKGWLESQLKALQAESVNIKRAIDSINQMRQNSPCFSLSTEGQLILNPNMVHTFPGGRTVDCKTYGESLSAQAEALQSKLIKIGKRMDELFSTGVFSPDEIIMTAGEVALQSQTAGEDNAQPAQMRPGVDYPVTEASGQTAGQQMEDNAIRAAFNWLQGQHNKGRVVSDAEFVRRLKAAAPGISEARLRAAVEVAREQGFIK